MADYTFGIDPNKLTFANPLNVQGTLEMTILEVNATTTVVGDPNHPVGLNTKISGDPNQPVAALLTGDPNQPVTTLITGDAKKPVATLITGDASKPVASTVEVLNIPRLSKTDIKDLLTPEIRMHVPNYQQICFKLLGFELFSICFSGETQVITEPYKPNAYERCEPSCCKPDTRPFPERS